jgi:hypothetical protein
MDKAIIAIVPTRGQADGITAELQTAGFAKESISVLLPDQRNPREFAHEQHTKAPEGAIAGVGVGGVAGGVLSLLACAVALPGFGALIAAGPIVAALSGIAVGGAVGGLTGALVGMGIPEYEAKMYEGKLRTGNIVIAVHTNDANEQKRAREIFKMTGVRHASTQTESHVPRHQHAY